MINTMTTLRTHLAAQTALTNLTGARIWAAVDYPLVGYVPADGAAIVFKGRGGPGLNYNSQLLTDSVQFKCYAATELAALDLYGVLVDVLNDGTGDGIRIAFLESAGQILREPEPLNWSFVLTYFRIIYDSGLGV